MELPVLLIAIIGLALVFDYINGFHDAANSIATIVSTKVLTPLNVKVPTSAPTFWATKADPQIKAVRSRKRLLFILLLIITPLLILLSI